MRGHENRHGLLLNGLPRWCVIDSAKWLWAAVARKTTIVSDIHQLEDLKIGWEREREREREKRAYFSEVILWFYLIALLITDYYAMGEYELRIRLAVFTIIVRTLQSTPSTMPVFNIQRNIIAFIDYFEPSESSCLSPSSNHRHCAL